MPLKIPKLKHKHDDFADRLNLAMDKEGFPPKNKGRIQLLAEMVGLTHRGASKWVNGESRPPAGKYADLAKKLNIRLDWLKNGEGEMMEKKEVPSLFLHEQISIPVYLIEDFGKIDKNLIQTIDCDLPIRGEGFAIKLESDAMSPRFPIGSIAIFDSGKTAQDGDFVLIKSSAYPLPILRQLLISGGINYLYAHNPKFDKLNLSFSDKILGVMIQAIISFI
jgi:SOS-response transcriptional repressor LexA